MVNFKHSHPFLGLKYAFFKILIFETLMYVI